MDQHRSLSPDDTVLLLRDLLRAYDPAFEPMKMSRVSGLECAIVRKTGEYIWAQRDEIQAQIPELQFRHDYAPTISVPTELHVSSSIGIEPTGAAFGSHQQSILPAIAPSSETNVAVVRSTVMMQICGAQNLRGTRKIGRLGPFCKWTLVSAAGAELANGRTPSHYGGSDPADWQGVTFSLRCSGKAATLSGCVLLFRVQVGTIIPGIK